jgi:MoaA/NifB/PqqE/SkfB family radical SAM enzyme
MNPKMLSVHYTAECASDCPGCYLKSLRGEEEIKRGEWVKLPAVASSMGVEKIALAVNDSRIVSVEISGECLFAMDFIDECYRNRVNVDITTLGHMAIYLFMLNSRLPKNVFEKIDVFTISVDNHKIRNMAQLTDICYIAEAIKNRGAHSLNANFLIDIDSESIINIDWFNRILQSFDTIHIIFEKPFPYSKDEYYTIIEALDKHGVFEDERFIIDPCILFRLGLVDHCHSCSYMVDISPNGNVAGCAYSHSNYPIGNINKMEELPVLLEKTEETFVTNCSFLEFIKDDENNKKRCSNTH